MLTPNTTIWHTRVQNVDALLTAVGVQGTEVYRLATVCQVGLEPPIVSISPNPEYPICTLIDAAGYFGLNFVAESQAPLVQRCYGLPRHHPDKAALLGLRIEHTDRGTPLLLDCIQSLEVRVDKAWNSGDHRTYIGEVVTRRRRALAHQRSHRFGGRTPPARRLMKRIACQSGLYDLVVGIRHRFQPPPPIEEGTRRHVPGAPDGIQTTGSRQAPPPVTFGAQAPYATAASTPGICLVGCGWWGAVHGLALKRQRGRIRRYYASRNVKHAKDFARRFNGQAFERVDDALADPAVDAVVIALPHDLQAEMAERALRAGKHVLVEKPIAVDVEAGQRVLRAAEDTGRCLAIAEEYRLSPLVQAARSLLRQGVLGRLSWVQAAAAGTHRPVQDWKNRRASMGGGVLIDVGVHYVDILRFWFGEPDLVWATYPPHINHRFEGEDGVITVLRFQDGPVATIALSWSAHRSREAPHLEVSGERGSLELRFDRPFLVHRTPLPPSHWTHRLMRILPWRVASRISPFLPKEAQRRIRVPNGDLIGSEALIADFIEAITLGRAPAVPGVEGLQDLRVVLAAYAAAETGAPVTIVTPAPRRLP